MKVPTSWFAWVSKEGRGAALLLLLMLAVAPFEKNAPPDNRTTPPGDATTTEDLAPSLLFPSRSALKAVALLHLLLLLLRLTYPPASQARARAPATLADSARYAPFFAEPPPDDAHCLASPPREQPAPGSPRAYVAPRCAGGLGNQLGCLGAAFSFALQYGRCLVVPEFFRHHSATAARGYNATFFRHFAEQRAVLPFVARPEDGGRADAQAPRIQQRDGDYGFANFSAQQPPLHGAWLAVAEGMFFHYRYTAPVRERFAAYVRPPPGVARALLSKYPGLARGVAVHFRRGDYVNITLPGQAPFSFPIPSPFFYAQSADLIAAGGGGGGGGDGGGGGGGGAARGELTFFIFTQDWAWARAQPFIARLPGRVVFVDGEDEVASFYMMMLAGEGVICANSTFCWWAAWLGLQNRRVFLPSPFAPWGEPTGTGGFFFPGAEVVFSEEGEGRRGRALAAAAVRDRGEL